MHVCALGKRVMLRFMLHPWWVCCAFVLLMPLAKAQELQLPTVFRIGQYESSYQLLLRKHAATLIEVVDNDLEQAHRVWQNVLLDIEEEAAVEEVDFDGVRLYLNVFWTAEGRIAHIAYFIKPNSKRIADEEVVGVLSKVIGTQTLRTNAKRAFVHFGSASFPITTIPRPMEHHSTGKPP